MLACPFCASTDLWYDRQPDYNGWEFSIQCQECGIRAPVFESEEERDRHWNRRAMIVIPSPHPQAASPVNGEPTGSGQWSVIGGQKKET